MRHRRNKRIISLLLAVLLTAGTCFMLPPVPSSAAGRTIHIRDIVDLKEFAEHCRLDTYSEGLIVQLDADLDLMGVPFVPIPTFMGVFQGNGHTISGFVCADRGSNQGLFRYLQKEGVISRLKVEGAVTPEGSRYNVGGIVGTSYGTVQFSSFSGEVRALVNTGGIVGRNYGTILGCTSEGKVIGKQYTGGIAGFNEGSIDGCIASAAVNGELVSESIDLSSLTLPDIVDLGNISVADSDTVMDTGGIVGGSTGIVTSCVNYGRVGYKHFGYNLGGIAGRQSGYLADCSNYGEICGRKDVAGIVGQMEPYLFLENSESLVDDLQDLNDSIGKAMEDLGSDADSMSEALSGLKGSSDGATDAAKKYNDLLQELIRKKQEENDQPSTWDKIKDQAGNTAGDVGNVIGGLDQETKDDILSGNINDGTIDKVQDSVDENGGSTGSVIGGIKDDYDKIDQGTKDDITSGNISSGDIEQIGGAAQDSVAADKIREQMQKREEAARKEQEEQLRKEQLAADAQAKLVEKVNKIGQGLASLNDHLAEVTGNFAENMKEVNTAFEKVNRLITKILTGDMVSYNDISEYDTDEDLEGKVASCRNFGRISGDKNVGGIAGEMAIEVEVDAEGSIVTGLTKNGIIANIYESRCVMKNCTNEASVEARKSHVGGLAGSHTLGILFYGENYGEVRGDSSYVGGIVGESSGWIHGCSAMCRLSGEEFVGGIAGQAVKLSDSMAIVTLEEERISCAGAIAGYADLTKAGTIVNNYFVSSTLGGIDGISYTGIAEPIEYRELAMRDTVPEQFHDMVVTFEAEGTTVRVVKVRYGTRFPAHQIPKVPEKEDFFGEWEEIPDGPIRESFTISAVYTAKRPSMSSELTRGETPLPVLIVEGDFEGDAQLTAELCAESMPSFAAGEAAEVLRIRVTGIAADESESFRLRYLPPDPTGEYVLYALSEDGAEREIASEQKGSYLVFPIEGEELTLAAVPVRKNSSKLVIAAAAVLIAAFGVILLRKKRH